MNSGNHISASTVLRGTAVDDRGCATHHRGIKRNTPSQVFTRVSGVALGSEVSLARIFRELVVGLLQASAHAEPLAARICPSRLGQQNISTDVVCQGGRKTREVLKLRKSEIELQDTLGNIASAVTAPVGLADEDDPPVRRLRARSSIVPRLPASSHHTGCHTDLSSENSRSIAI